MRTMDTDSPSVVVDSTASSAADSRRSIRQYEPTPIPDADLRELLRLAGRAPSAYNAQPWRFVVVQDAALKARLAAAAYGQRQVTAAPATIVMYSDMQDALERMPESMHPGMPEDQRTAGVESFRATFTGQTVEQREAWGIAQSNIALGYLLLLAESLGYATSPMLGFHPEQVKALLGLPAHVRITALVTIGLAAEDGFAPHRLPAESLVTFR
ncbi:MAG: nitroreductase family protein [Gemmatimonadaceae bacterium]|nr:nitroreductase family protein [Gemmatimonadaceae bacterium]